MLVFTLVKRPTLRFRGTFADRLHVVILNHSIENKHSRTEKSFLSVSTSLKVSLTLTSHGRVNRHHFAQEPRMPGLMLRHSASSYCPCGVQAWLRNPLPANVPGRWQATVQLCGLLVPTWRSGWSSWLLAWEPTQSQLSTALRGVN